MDGGTFTNTNIGGIKSDVFISKMNSNLDKIWSIQFAPSGGDMTNLYLLIDKNDNLYVHGTGTHPNLYKYNSDGNLINTINIPVPIPYEIKIDNSGNVLIGGNLKLYKFNESGVNIWNNVSYEHDPLVKIHIDSLNYVYLLHHNETTRRITKFNPNSNNEGVLLNLMEFAHDFTIDNENNIIVSAYDGIRGGIYKYNSTGSHLWTNSYSPGVYYIENDNFGNIYATRGSKIKKLSSSGLDEWFRDFNLGVYNSNELQSSNLIINNYLFSIYVIGTTSSYIGTNSGSPPNVFITRTWTYKTVKE